MNNTITHNELISRKQNLQRISVALKDKFLGLDGIIDEVISLMMPWYLFPEGQLRPTVINLWGLTGSGKTALVQAIVELLDCRKVFSHLDMGEYESDSASWIKSILTDDLSFFDGKQAILCLDEFQFARTIDANKNELGKDKLRVVWDLIDTGKIEYIPGNSNYYLFRADNCLRRLEKLLHMNVRLLEGKIVGDIDGFKTVFEGFYFENEDRYNQPISETYFTCDDFIAGMYGLFYNDEYSKEEIKRRMLGISIEELIAFIIEGMRTRPATRTLDLSRALIFILGNLDEAYFMSQSMNPDISADEFHEQTSRITIADIKQALKKRFRPEQIARLGNNHIVYKSFSSAQFRALIRQQLHRVSDFMEQRFRWKLYFDDSVVDIVYAEGVFPAQGTRPVFTTIKNLIESRVASLAVSILEEQLEVKAITWKYEQEQFCFVLQNEEGRVLKTLCQVVRLKLENLRKSVDPQLQAHTAVHESGHAILAALTFRILPSVVVSRTASESEGFCLVNYPKGPETRNSLKKDIIVALGGFVAEKMIFGEEFTCSGVYSDIQVASELANRAIQKYAMGRDPLHLSRAGSDNDDAFIVSEKQLAEATRLVKECEMIAEQILSRNKLLLLKMAEYLTENSRMEELMIGDFVKRYATEKWPIAEGFMRKEDYYRFDEMVRRQLREVESLEIENVLQTLVSEGDETIDETRKVKMFSAAQKDCAGTK
jgi:hypothetical protein